MSNRRKQAPKAYRERKPVPPVGGAMRSKQDKRRQTRQTRRKDWLDQWYEQEDEYEADQD